MSTLPTYESRDVPPAVQQRGVPTRSPALEALGQAGQTAQSIGAKFSEDAMRLKREADVTNLTTSWGQKLFDFRQKALQSPDFYSDPIGTSNQFAKGVKAMGDEATKGIKDPQIRQMFTRYWAEDSLRNLDHMSTLAVTQSNNLSAGQFQGDIIKWKTMAEQTPDEKEGLQYLGRALGIQGMMAARGLIKPEKATEDAEKMRSEFAESRVRSQVFHDPQAAIDSLQARGGVTSMLRPDRAAQLEEMASKELQRRQTHADAEKIRADKALTTAQNNKLYSSIYSDFHLGDPKNANWDAAIEYAQKSPPGLTVDPMDQSGKVVKALEGEQARLQKVKEQKDKAVTKGFSDWYSDRMAKGAPPSRDEINGWKDKDGNPASGSDREKALEKIGKPEKTSREAEDALDTRIEQHPFSMKDDSSIHDAYLDGKISEQDKNRLIGKYTLWHDPVKSPALQAARDAFWSRYGDPKILKQDTRNQRLAGSDQYKRYIQQFENLVGQQNLSPSQYQEQAGKMLADVDKNVIGSWHGWTNGSAQDYYKFWGSWPEEQVQPAGQSVTRPIPQQGEDISDIPADKQAGYKAELAKQGLPPSAKNIRWLHDQQESK